MFQMNNCAVLLKYMHKCRSYGPDKSGRMHVHYTEVHVVTVMSRSPQAGSTKNGAQNVVASAQMKFASEARLRSVFHFDNTEPTCMPLSGHLMDTEVQVLVYQTEKYQLMNEVCIRS